MSKRSADGSAGLAAKKARTDDVDSAMRTLLGSKMTVSDFNDKYWTKKHMHLKHGKSAAGGNVFSKEMGCATLPGVYETIKTQSNYMNWELTMEAVRSVDGKKQKMSPEEGEIKLEEVQRLYNDEKCTLQFHQPQHYNIDLAKFMSKLEDYFGTCVGANTYLTPAGAQGLAPHYDTVDILVCQIQGTKTWHLSKGLVDMPLDDSGDLEMTSLGEKLETVVMEEGDFLYMPRGTVHYATTSDSASSHITFSTADENYKGRLLSMTLDNAVHAATDKLESFRDNLPRDLFKNFGIFPTGSDVDARKKRRSALKDNVEELVTALKPFLLDAMDDAVDSIASEFIARRLPPASKITPEHFKLDEYPEEMSESDVVLEDTTKLRITPESCIRVVKPDFSKHGNMDLSVFEDDEEEAGEGAPAGENGKGGKSAAKPAAADAADVAKPPDVDAADVSNLKDTYDMMAEAAKNSFWLIDNLSNQVVGHMVESLTEDCDATAFNFEKELGPMVEKLFNSGESGIVISELEKGVSPELNARAFLRTLINKGVIAVV